MKNWKTTLVFGSAAAFEFAAKAWPEYSAIFDHLAQASIAVGGLLAADAPK